MTNAATPNQVTFLLLRPGLDGLSISCTRSGWCKRTTHNATWLVQQPRPATSKL